MAKYKSKPNVIEAEQFFIDQPLPFRDKGPYVCIGCIHSADTSCSQCGRFFVITAHRQRVFLEDGDWIVLEPVGPLVPSFAAYPVKPDIFATRYELAEE